MTVRESGDRSGLISRSRQVRVLARSSRLLDTMMDTSQQRLQHETASAWREYLDATRNAIGFRYEEVEPWAWTKLHTRLQAIESRRRSLGSAS